MALSAQDIASNPNAGSLKQKLAKYLLGELVGYNSEGVMNDPTQFYNQENILNRANDLIAKGLPEELAKKGATSAMREGARIAPFLGDASLDNAKLMDWAKLAGTASVHHPFKTAGLVGAAAGNIGGLTDNDKFGGQLGGLALGGLGAATLASGNPYAAAMMVMGGGNIGALFDKLRARKEMEQAQGYQNAGNPIAMLGRR